MMQLGEILDSVYKLAPASIEKMEAEATLRHYAKGDRLVVQDRPCRSVFFAADGLCRSLHEQDGREDTRWFATPGDVFTSVSAWHNDEPAIFSIEAITPLSCYVISFQAMRRLLAEDEGIRQWTLRLLSESLYVLEKRYTIIGRGSARERYEALLQGRPKEMINLIPLKYIASYLKITQETLSRIRGAR
ncbi:MAG: Crp/Fnr family transcriptional regulator [Muribaculaceae bacterium]|nr:Crp/Fnr family transcriptional regulator [Muribaculaceae bacterium]